MAKKLGRVGESDIRNAVLDIIRSKPNREITTTKLIAELRLVVSLNSEDEEQLDGRNDDRFSQIVREVVPVSETGA